MIRMASSNVNFNIDGVMSIIEQKMNQKMSGVGNTLVNDIKSAAPVDTGKLRDSISHKEDTSNTSTTICAGVDYAQYVEYKKPFMKPAVDKYKSNIVKMFENLF